MPGPDCDQRLFSHGADGRRDALLVAETQSAWEQRTTPPEEVMAIDQLLNDYPEHQVAGMLTQRGMKSGTGQPFSPRRVTRIRIAYHLSNRWTRLRQQGKLSARELSYRLAVSCGKIRRCGDLGWLRAHEYKAGPYLYDDPGTDVVERIPQLKRNAHLTAAHATKEVQYAT